MASTATLVAMHDLARVKPCRRSAASMNAHRGEPHAGVAPGFSTKACPRRWRRRTSTSGSGREVERREPATTPSGWDRIEIDARLPLRVTALRRAGYRRRIRSLEAALMCLAIGDDFPCLTTNSASCPMLPRPPLNANITRARRCGLPGPGLEAWRQPRRTYRRPRSKRGPPGRNRCVGLKHRPRAGRLPSWLCRQ